MELQITCNMTKSVQSNSGCKLLALSTVWRQIKRILLVALLAFPVHAIAADLSPKGDISYISGGVGLEERTLFQEQSNNYNLHLSFAQEKTGEYLADIHVSIRNMKGDSIFETKSEGPLLYVKLPAGKYRIEAAYDGKIQSRNTSLTTKPRTIFFYWPE